MLRSENACCEYRKVSPFESESLDLESSLQETPEDDIARPPPSSILLGWAHRLCILFTGLFLGFATFMPNGMMSDSGTRLAVICANIGIWASVFFCVAGVVGAITKKWYLFKYACGLQLLALSSATIATFSGH